MNRGEGKTKDPSSGETTNTIVGAEKKIYAAQVEMLYTGATFGSTMSFASALVFTFVSWGSISHTTLLTWFCSILIITALQFVLISAYKRNKPPAGSAKKWAFRYFLSTVASGMTWGAAGIFLFASLPITHQVFLILIIGVLNAGAVVTYSPIMAVFFAFAIPSALSITIHSLLISGEIYLGIGVMGALYIVTIMFMARHANGVIRTSLGLSLENKDLVDDLRDSKDRYKTLFELDNSILECSPIGIMKLGPTLSVEYINPALKIIAGVPEGEAHMSMGEKLTDISSIINADFTSLADKLMQGEEVEFETFFRTIYEKDVFLSIKAVPLLGNAGFDGAIATISDITDQVKTGKKLKQLTNAIEQSDRMVVITDRDGIIEYVNPAVTAQSLYSSEELIGQSTRIFKSGKHDFDFYRNMWDTILMGETWNSQIMNKRKNGETYYEEITISPVINDDGVIINFVAIKNDITDRIMAEEELKDARAMAEEAAQSAEKANKAKSSFLAHMSHELRTPLNGILGLSDIMLKTVTDEDDQKHLEMIKHSGTKLLTLVNDILDLERIEAGKIELLKLEFDLRETIGKISEHFSISAEIKGIEYTSYIADEVPNVVMGDPDKLWQIIVNLIGNAIKFTKKGSVALGVTVDETTDDMVITHFCVKDTGIGIAKANQAQIFDRFTQEDGSITKVYGGAGLGTTISKQLIEMMGGRIWFESEPGKGSAFHFTVPLEILSAQLSGPTGNLLSREVNSATQTKKHMKIILAEDDLVNREVASAALHILGHSVTVAPNGKEAVKIWEKGESDLILMDVEMPDMDGFEATRIIRKKEQGTNEHIPIIAMTARVMRGDRDDCISAGMDEHTPKPMTVESLHNVINRVFTLDNQSTPLSFVDGTSKPTGDEALYDLSIIYKALKNDRQQINRLIEMFINTNNQKMPDLEEAIKLGDITKVRFIAHSIKGSALQIKAPLLANAASCLEDMRSVEDLEETLQALDKLTTAYELVKQQLTKELEIKFLQD